MIWNDISSSWPTFSYHGPLPVQFSYKKTNDDKKRNHKPVESILGLNMIKFGEIWTIFDGWYACISKLSLIIVEQEEEDWAGSKNVG